MPRFCPKRLRSSQHPYPELQSKAWNEPCIKLYHIHFMQLQILALQYIYIYILCFFRSYLSDGWLLHGWMMPYKTIPNRYQMTKCSKRWRCARCSAKNVVGFVDHNAREAHAVSPCKRDSSCSAISCVINTMSDWRHFVRCNSRVHHHSFQRTAAWNRTAAEVLFMKTFMD